MERLKIAITGATGFIGSNLVKYFNKDHEVYALSHTNKNWRLDGLDTIPLDISDKPKCNYILNKIKPDVLVHCAAYGINPFEKDVRKIIATNIIGTLNVLDSCKDASLFINTGSCFEYGIQNESVKESTKLIPETNYAMSKALVSNLMQSNNEVKTVTLRLFTAYGYNEAKHRLIPYLIYSSLFNKTAELSNKNNVRDFIFIEDVLSAYNLVIKHHEQINNGAVFNVGYGKQTFIEEVVRIVGTNVKWIPSIRPSEPKRMLKADITKIKNELSWRPKYPLKEGIEKTKKWMLENIKLYEN